MAETKRICPDCKVEMKHDSTEYLMPINTPRQAHNPLYAASFNLFWCPSCGLSRFFVNEKTGPQQTTL